MKQKNINDVPSMIGRYRLIQKIGQGGMGQVFKAMDTSLERTVALKLLLPGAMSNRDAVQRFIREAKSNARLRHPNIVTLYDFECDSERNFIVMDFIDGCPLDRLIKQRKLNWQKACFLTIKVLDALAYAHGEGIIHRDIKPSNILLDKQGTPYVTDFGLAKALTENTVQISATGVILGTPAYMSPEQAKGDPVDLQSDIYSVGAMFYEMLTGRLPLEGDTPYVLLYKLANEIPPPPRTINSKIPEAIEAVCLQAMEKDKEKRYGLAEQMLKDVKAYLQENAQTQKLTPIAGSSSQQRQNLTARKSRPRDTLPPEDKPKPTQAQVKKAQPPARKKKARYYQLAIAALVVLVFLAIVNKISKQKLEKQAQWQWLHIEKIEDIVAKTWAMAEYCRNEDYTHTNFFRNHLPNIEKQRNELDRSPKLWVALAQYLNTKHANQARNKRQQVADNVARYLVSISIGRPWPEIDAYFIKHGEALQKMAQQNQQIAVFWQKWQQQKLARQRQHELDLQLEKADNDFQRWVIWGKQLGSESDKIAVKSQQELANKIIKSLEKALASGPSQQSEQYFQKHSPILEQMARGNKQVANCLQQWQKMKKYLRLRQKISEDLQQLSLLSEKKEGYFLVNKIQKQIAEAREQVRPLQKAEFNAELTRFETRLASCSPPQDNKAPQDLDLHFAKLCQQLVTTTEQELPQLLASKQFNKFGQKLATTKSLFCDALAIANSSRRRDLLEQLELIKHDIVLMENDSKRLKSWIYRCLKYAHAHNLKVKATLNKKSHHRSIEEISGENDYFVLSPQIFLGFENLDTQWLIDYAPQIFSGKNQYGLGALLFYQRDKRAKQYLIQAYKVGYKHASHLLAKLKIPCPENTAQPPSDKPSSQSGLSMATAKQVLQEQIKRMLDKDFRGFIGHCSQGYRQVLQQFAYQRRQPPEMVFYQMAQKMETLREHTTRRNLQFLNIVDCQISSNAGKQIAKIITDSKWGMGKKVFYLIAENGQWKFDGSNRDRRWLSDQPVNKGPHNKPYRPWRK